MARRPPEGPLGVALTVAVAAAYMLWLRPRILGWGATREEVTAGYPGDEIIPSPTGGATMATTLPAPPEKLWPWLVQMGGDRGGWYSHDWLDNNGRPSADRIVPEWQHLGLGQHLSRTAAPGQQPGALTVVRLQTGRTLVLRSTYGLFTGRDVDPGSNPPPRAWVDGIWGFHLRPVAGGATRLVVRTRSRGRPSLVSRSLNVVLAEPLHVVMQARQFRNLRRRATGTTISRSGAVQH
jgi:hypothetical protein